MFLLSVTVGDRKGDQKHQRRLLRTLNVERSADAGDSPKASKSKNEAVFLDLMEMWDLFLFCVSTPQL